MSSALVKVILVFQSLTSIRFAYIKGNHHHVKCSSIIAKLKLEVNDLKFYKDAESKTEKFECKLNVSVIPTNTTSNKDAHRAAVQESRNISKQHNNAIIVEPCHE
jgi:hypothetical protein